MPLSYTLIAGLFGLIVGSFLNVIIYRLPIMLLRQWQHDVENDPPDTTSSTTTIPETFNLAVPRSHCPVCKNPVAAWHNIPVISWLLLKRACAHCQTPISGRYPLVELLSAIAAMAAFGHFSTIAAAIGATLFLWGLIVATGIDLDHQLLPDEITWPLLMLGLAFGLNNTFISLQQAVMGALIGYYTLWIIYWIFRFITHREGFGFGDFRLLCAIGAWVGWQLIPPIILIASVSGLITAFVMHTRHTLQPNNNEPMLRAKIPFGPHLALGGAITLLAQEHVIQWIGFTQ